jgi:urease beta subunit
MSLLSSPPSLSIGDVAVTEGNSGTTAFVFQVSLSRPIGRSVKVHYATVDGTATAPGDYQPASATLTIKSGKTTGTVTVLAKGDTALEPDEQFLVKLSAPTRATIADDTGVGTILDDDAPTVSIGDTSVSEGDAGFTLATFTLTLSAPSTQPVSVDYQTADGSATSLSDYTAASDTVDFTPGATTADVTILVQGDVLSENDETFSVDLSAPVNARILDGHGVGTILDDDPLPELSIGDEAVAEGNSGTTPATFTVTLSAESGRTVTVDYATSDGTATQPGDYQPGSGTLTFSPGQTSKTVTVLVNGDSTVEANETFTVDLSNPAGATVSGSGIGTGTITDDDVPISIAAATVTEGNSGTVNAVFAVTLGAASANTVTVDYSTFDGSAAAPGDYAAASGTLTFTPGQTAKQIVVAVNGDTTVETNETFTVNLTNPTDATVSGTGIATGTITNDDALPTVTIANVTANEGNSGTTNFAFGVTLSAASSSTVTVDYSTFDGSAVAPGDYAATSGTLTFSPGQTAKQIVVAVNGDTTVEANETFTVNLTNPADATISGSGIGTGTITNDDALPTVTIANVTANEGNSGTTNFAFAVTLSAVSANTVTVDYSTFDGSAVVPGDYAATSGTLTFTPGETAKQIVVAVNGDTTVEASETFTVALSNPSNATISGTGVGTGTITNDDALPTVTIAAVTANEGNSGTTSFAFAVTLSAVSSSTVTVDYSTFDGSAVAPGDYAATSGTLTFTPGQTAKQIVVAVNGDPTVVASETFTVALSNPSNATISGTGVGTGTVTNDDALPTVTIAAVTVTEGNSGTVNAVFAVTLSAASSSTVTVDYSTFDGSAVAPGDYAATSGTLTFTAGQTAKQIVVAVNGDTTVETTETFTVNLSNPSNATISGTGVGTGTITNDDALPTLTIANVTVTEGNSGTVNAVFAVTLSAASSSTVTVDYSTFDGSAVAPGDYVATSGTLTFTPGQTAKQVVVPVKGETLNEVNETYTVNLTNPANATVSGTGIATGTITNDDAVPTLSINNVSLAEGNSGTTSFTFTVTLSAASGLPVSVDFATADGAAVAPGDYQSQTGTLTFSPGQTTKTITVIVNGDGSIEANETFTVVLSNPVNATITTGTGTGTITNDD